jgi:hypothetical protein
MTSSNANIFLLGEPACISRHSGFGTLRLAFLNWNVDVTIQGKVNAKLYVASIRAPSKSYVQYFAGKYGLPNRHLKLEYGCFHGWDFEFVVPVEDLSK